MNILVYLAVLGGACLAIGIARWAFEAGDRVSTDRDFTVTFVLSIASSLAALGLLLFELYYTLSNFESMQKLDATELLMGLAATVATLIYLWVSVRWIEAKLDRS